ncbi:hypothetical protein [Mesonia sp. K7]|uniref:hypothetical protein n=1 Tax=Mesonia sp. K7 TaxID=2218606 RepID=UPI0011B74E4E|nr:hypothetical protein [Mesonia sp. K7]
MQQLLKQNPEDHESEQRSRIQLENYPIGFVKFLEIKKQDCLVDHTEITTFYFSPYKFLEVREHDHPPNFIV